MIKHLRNRKKKKDIFSTSEKAFLVGLPISESAIASSERKKIVELKKRQKLPNIQTALVESVANNTDSRLEPDEEVDNKVVSTADNRNHANSGSNSFRGNLENLLESSTDSITPQCHVKAIHVGSNVKQFFFEDLSQTKMKQKVDLSHWTFERGDFSFLQNYTSNDIMAELIVSCSTINDDAAYYFQFLTNLRSFSCSECPLLSIRFCRYISPFLTNLNVSGNICITDNAISIIVKKFPKISTLNIANCQNLTNQSLLTLSEKLSLKSIDISGCLNLGDDGILPLILYSINLLTFQACNLPMVKGLTFGAFERKKNNLSQINLSGSSLHFSAIDYLARGCKNIQILVFDNCYEVQNNNLKTIGSHCCHLQRLSILNCAQITDEGIANLFCTHAIKKIAHLDISGCSLISSMGIIDIATNSPNLQALSISGLNSIEKSGIQSLLDNCSKLSSFKFCGQLVSRDAGKMPSFFSMPNITKGMLRRKIQPNFFKNLKTLHLANTKCQVHDLAKCLLQCKKLEDLNISSLTTNDIVNSIAEACKSIRKLNLSRSRYFQESYLENLISSCTKLQVIDLQHCEQISDMFLKFFKDAECRFCIRSLHLAGNWQLTEDGVQNLVLSCPRIENLNVNRCTEISSSLFIGMKHLVYCQPAVRYNGLEPRQSAIVNFQVNKLMEKNAAQAIVGWVEKTIQIHKDTKEKLKRALFVVERRKKAAKDVQRIFRGMLARRFTKKLREQQIQKTLEKREQSSITIQRYWRGYTQRMKYLEAIAIEREKKQRALYEQRMKLENHSAIHIQRIGRGFIARKYRERLLHNLRVQKLAEVQAAVDIQRIYRGYLARTQFIKLIKEKSRLIITQIIDHENQIWASLEISRIIRGLLGKKRKLMRLKEIEDAINLQNQSAKQIQHCFRAFKVRVTFRRTLQRGAIAMQSLFRGYIGRKKARIDLICRCYHLQIPSLLICQYSIFRRDLIFQCKIRYNAGECMALFAQKWYRYWQGRILFNVCLAEQRHLDYTINCAAKCIQRFFRKCHVAMCKERLRLLIILRNQSSTKIQSIWRMWCGKLARFALELERCRKEQHDMIINLALSSIDNVLGSEWNRMLLLRSGCIYRLVNWYKFSLKLRGWVSASELRSRIVKLIKIQSLWRGYQARIFVVWYREAINVAAKYLQTLYRGKIGRRKWRSIIVDRKKKAKIADEENKAALVSRKITNQYSFDVLQKHEAAAVVLQRMYRTLAARHVYKKIKIKREEKFRLEARNKVVKFLESEIASPIFQASVWQDVLGKKKKGEATADSVLNVPSVEEALLIPNQIEQEIILCENEHIQYLQLQSKQHTLEVKAGEFDKEAKVLEVDTSRYQLKGKPFAAQCKDLAFAHTRVSRDSKRIQHEIIRLVKNVKNMHHNMAERFVYDPSLYRTDINRLLKKLDDGPLENKKPVEIDWLSDLRDEALQTLEDKYGQEFRSVVN